MEATHSPAEAPPGLGQGPALPVPQAASSLGWMCHQLVGEAHGGVGRAVLLGRKRELAEARLHTEEPK